jgi:acyl transferase domain-containing protein
MTAPSPAQPEVVFAFGGQGSQYYQMGRHLFAADADFRRIMIERDAVIRAACGRSMLDEIYGAADKHAPFRDINYTHLALLLFQCALADLLRLWGIVPDRLLGCSAGELCASVVAGAIDYADAVAIVDAQAQAMQRLCGKAYMIAVLADERRALDIVAAAGPCWLATRSAAENVTITGPRRHRAQALAALARAAVPCSDLAIEYGFHSPLIDPMEQAVRRRCRAISWRPARVPVVSCATGAEVPPRGEDWAWGALRGMVDLPAAVASLEATGGRRVYYDLSPSGGLCSLLRRELLGAGPSRAVAVVSPFLSNLSAIHLAQQTRARSLAAAAG